ncbi:MAG: hypothetical protein EU533_08740 [Promethearchaeota archaeon]|nr:MAG: hypothetical protein EU533_08740 [Candidatus Lokiarchaeota archaeon]
MAIISLDKWIKTEKKSKKVIKNKDTESNQGENTLNEHKIQKEHLNLTISKFEKFELTCSNSKCKYKKILKKKRISERDIICPRCKNEMKVKKC